jgi:DNA-binding GntR family transcriptional regulator
MATDLTGEPFSAATEPIDLRLPSRSLLADDVYTILRDSLRAGRIAAGSRLNLDHLARELHVSNTPVRQALARLEADGLVTKEPYRGFTASPLLDSRHTAELYEFRLILEPPLAARATANANASGEGLKEIAELCDPDEIERLLEAGDSTELGRRDLVLHLTLARLAGNSMALESLTHAFTRQVGYTAQDHRDKEAQAWREHQALVAAVLAGDSRGAAAAMREHLHGAYKRFRSIA